ncbi:MAG: GNAT family N-acetyltransferase [Candidatus Odinarchaeota archaeon]
MLSPFPDLYHLQKSDIKPASHMMAEAFHGDSIWVFSIPDPDERKKKLPVMYELLLKYGLKYGIVVSSSSNLEGISIWLPDSETGLKIAHVLRSGGIFLMFKIGQAIGKRIELVMEEYDSIRQKHVKEPHWYLQFIAVDPNHQNKGFASSIIRIVLQEFSNKGISVYLDTETERNVRIYQHLGFKVVHEGLFKAGNFNHWGMMYKR